MTGLDIVGKLPTAADDHLAWMWSHKVGPRAKAVGPGRLRSHVNLCTRAGLHQGEGFIGSVLQTLHPQLAYSTGNLIILCPTTVCDQANETVYCEDIRLLILSQSREFQLRLTES